MIWNLDSEKQLWFYKPWPRGVYAWYTTCMWRTFCGLHNESQGIISTNLQTPACRLYILYTEWAYNVEYWWGAAICQKPPVAIATYCTCSLFTTMHLPLNIPPHTSVHSLLSSPLPYPPPRPPLSFQLCCIGLCAWSGTCGQQPSCLWRWLQQLQLRQRREGPSSIWL